MAILDVLHISESIQTNLCNYNKHFNMTVPDNFLGRHITVDRMNNLYNSIPGTRLK